MSEEVIEVKLQNLAEELRGVHKELKTLNEKFLSIRLCPMPGKCVELDSWINDHESRLRRIEDLIAQMKGLGMVAKLLWMTIGAGVGALLVKFAQAI